MENCENCKWEKEGMFCLQGHVRRIEYEEMKAIGHFNIENCHAWGGKPREGCWCDKPFFRMVTIQVGKNQYATEAQFCPVCGKPKNNWGK